MSLSGWSVLAAVALLLALMFGIGTISYFFAGESTPAGFCIGLLLTCGGAVGLLELGRRGGAPQQDWKVLFPGLVSAGLALAFLATRSAVFALLIFVPLLLWAKFQRNE
ncbi:MAG: hypothetical protein U0R51_11520 [Solirubrobacterales bacterium]